MQSIRRAWRRIRAMRQGQAVSLLTLTVGLTLAFLLYLKLEHERSYNRFLPHIDQIYMLSTEGDIGDGEIRSYPQVPGAIAPGMKEEVPGVELATRITGLVDAATLYDADMNSYVEDISLADEYFFDLFEQPILKGNPHEVLTRPTMCMISDRLAEKLGKDAVGKRLTIKTMPGVEIEVGGVYQAFPSNSTLSSDVYVSMVSYDSTSYNNWIGNDRYKGYVKLSPGTKVEDVKAATMTMLAKHVDMEELKSAGAKFWFSIEPLKTLYQSLPTQKRLMNILTVVLLSILFATLLNYVLLRLSTIISRQKQLLLERSIGATRFKLWMGEFAEGLIMLLLALLIGALLIFLARKPVAWLIENSLSELLIPSHMILGLLGLIALLAVVAYLPTRYILRLPLRAAISGHRGAKSIWRQLFIGLELTFVGLLTALLIVVSLQYKGMSATDMGYKHEGLYTFSVMGADSTKIHTAINELQSRPWVESLSLSTQLPYTSQSGDNLINFDTKQELFNVADFFDVDTAYFKTFEIPLLQKLSDTEIAGLPFALYLSEAAAKKAAQMMQWSDGVLGKELILTSYGKMTIAGVYADVASTRKSIDPFPAKHPSAMVQRKVSPWYLMLTLRIRGNASEHLAELQQIADATREQGDAVVDCVSDRVLAIYESQKRMRDTVWTGAGVALLLALIGLWGYIATEMGRRRRELGIRRVLGASVSELIKQVVGELARVALLALALGVTLGFFVGRTWQSGFSFKAALPWAYFAAAYFLLLLIVVLIVSAKTWLTQRHAAARDISVE